MQISLLFCLLSFGSGLSNEKGPNKEGNRNSDAHVIPSTQFRYASSKSADLCHNNMFWQLNSFDPFMTQPKNLVLSSASTTERKEKH